MTGRGLHATKKHKICLAEGWDISTPGSGASIEFKRTVCHLQNLREIYDADVTTRGNKHHQPAVPPDQSYSEKRQAVILQHEPQSSNSEGEIIHGI